MLEHEIENELADTYNINFVVFLFWFVAAFASLKRKKRLEKQLSQIDGTLSTIEFQRETLESATTNAEVLKSMSFAAKSLKAAQQNL